MAKKAPPYVKVEIGKGKLGARVEARDEKVTVSVVDDGEALPVLSSDPSENRRKPTPQEAAKLGQTGFKVGWQAAEWIDRLLSK